MTNLIKGASKDCIAFMHIWAKIKSGEYKCGDVTDTRPEDIPSEVAAEMSGYVEPALLGLYCRPVGVLVGKQGEYTFIDKKFVPAMYLFAENKFRLDGLTVATELNGKTFSELSPLLQGRIEDYKVEMRLLSNSDTDQIALFRRAL